MQPAYIHHRFWSSCYNNHFSLRDIPKMERNKYNAGWGVIGGYYHTSSPPPSVKATHIVSFQQIVTEIRIECLRQQKKEFF